MQDLFPCQSERRLFQLLRTRESAVFASNTDRFAALDELAPPDGALLGGNKLFEKADREPNFWFHSFVAK
jgi:hypothetical protein